MLNKINDISKFINKKSIFLRLDLNVPIKNGIVANKKRIISSLPTIHKILENNPKNIFISSHLGRPNGSFKEDLSLKYLIPEFKKLNLNVNFIDNCIGEEAISLSNDSRNGNIFLLENLRFYPEEEGKVTLEGKKIKIDKERIDNFRNRLNKIGEIYINDAFGTCHRAHSSIVGINHKIRSAGLLIEKEIKYLSQISENPQKPVLAILGGAKIQDKVPLIINLIDKVDEIIIGGAMAFTFLKIINNIEIGNTKFDQEGTKYVRLIMEKAKEKNVKIHLPKDFIIGNKLNENSDIRSLNSNENIPNDWMGLDIGEKTIMENTNIISNSKTLFFNGPQGLFEIEKFSKGSIKMVEDIVNLTKENKLTSIVGGGDSINLLSKVKDSEKYISHISTGGGASLEYLEGKILPGIKHLLIKNY